MYIFCPSCRCTPIQTTSIASWPPFSQPVILSTTPTIHPSYVGRVHCQLRQWTLSATCTWCPHLGLMVTGATILPGSFHCLEDDCRRYLMNDDGDQIWQNLDSEQWHYCSSALVQPHMSHLTHYLFLRQCYPNSRKRPMNHEAQAYPS